MRNVDIIVFNGTTFRRYPDATQWAERSYYSPGADDRKRGVGRLHEEVWKHHHGRPVPPGHEIHHADFNPINNAPGNLVCLTVAEHKEAHRARGRARCQTPEHREHLDRIRPLAAPWHGSEEGRAWHRAHAAEVGLGGGQEYGVVCEQCSTAFVSRSSSRHARFCSNNCKSAWRRASGVDNEERACETCGATFTINRYAKRRFCRRACIRSSPAA